MKILRPMLAASFDPNNDREWAALLAKLPLYASPKLDGVRAIIQDGKVFSRSMKLIPNAHVQRLFGKAKLEGFDGELILGTPTSPTAYRDTVSAVMRREGEPAVIFYVFDHATDEPFFSRKNDCIEVAAKFFDVLLVPQVKIETESELEAMEAKYLKEGFEGMILRTMGGPYKQNRSTFKEGFLIKLKRFVDAEATVEGVIELMHNTNDVEVSEIGRTKRSHLKAGMVPGGTMGALLVRNNAGVSFEIGTGFTDLDRKEWYELGQDAIGKVIVYKSFPIGAYDKPRHPVYKGLRYKEDM